MGNWWDEQAPEPEQASSSEPELLDALNNGSKVIEDIEDVVALNNWANSNPDYPLAGNLRGALNIAANDAIKLNEVTN